MIGRGCGGYIYMLYNKLVFSEHPNISVAHGVLRMLQDLYKRSAPPDPGFYQVSPKNPEQNITTEATINLL